MMKSLGKCEAGVKTKLRMASGFAIEVWVCGRRIHRKTVVWVQGLRALLEEPGLLDMRVGTFAERYARCVGAQVGAVVRIEFNGRPVDGRVALKNLTA